MKFIRINREFEDPEVTVSTPELINLDNVLNVKIEVERGVSEFRAFLNFDVAYPDVDGGYYRYRLKELHSNVMSVIEDFILSDDKVLDITDYIR